MNEMDFLAGLRGLPLHPGARGLEDDCAVLELGGEALIINHDMMAEDTHFHRGTDMADVAWKLVALNLSDLASKGAEPVGVLLGHTLGGDDAAFLSGLHEVLAVYDVALLGGDTISSTSASTFALTAIGRATHIPVPSRKGAQVGDSLYVTGTLGRAMLGFEGEEQHRDAFNRPTPRIAEGRALAPHVNAMMDVSDGLLLDGWRIAETNEVTIRFDTASIPVADPDRLDDCVRWGDDYELLFAAPADAELPVSATKIGSVETATDAPVIFGETPLRSPDSLGYRHG